MKKRKKINGSKQERRGAGEKKEQRRKQERGGGVETEGRKDGARPASASTGLVWWLVAVWVSKQEEMVVLNDVHFTGATRSNPLPSQYPDVRPFLNFI